MLMDNVRALGVASRNMALALSLPGPTPNFPAKLGFIDGHPQCVGAHILANAGFNPGAITTNKVIVIVRAWLSEYCVDTAPDDLRGALPTPVTKNAAAFFADLALMRNVGYQWFEVERANDDSVGAVQIAAIRIALKPLVGELAHLYTRCVESHNALLRR